MAAGEVVTLIEDNVARKGNYFDGTDDYVLHDAHVVERVAANDLTGTYSAWIYINSQPVSAASMTILSAGDNDSANEFMNFGVLGTTDTNFSKLSIGFKQGGAVQFLVRSTASLMPLRTWTHVAVVQNGIRPTIYFNGEAVAMSDQTSTDLTMWYDELANSDKFAIGIKESNGTHTEDWDGAIGQVKYWNRDLSAAEVFQDFNGKTLANGDFPEATYLRLNVTMADNGITDSGAGADNGTLTGNAHYGSFISAHSIALELNTNGHENERSTTFPIAPSKLCSVIIKGN